jgi:hypothetical protein
MGFAQLTDEEVEAFEATAPDMLVQTRFGTLWICPGNPRGDDGLPWVTLRSFRDLAQSFAALVASGEGLAGDAEGPVDEGEDAVANDFGDDVEFV